jgi:adenylate cyclase
MRPSVRGLLVGVVVAALSSGLWLVRPDLFGIERLYYYAMSRKLAKTLPVDPRIVIVSINDKSLQSLEPFYGRWPFDRETMARVVEEAGRGGAALVVFDIFFRGENRQGGEGDLRFASAMKDVPVVLAAQTSRSTIDRSEPAASRLWPISGATDMAAWRLQPPLELFQPSAGLGTMRLAENASLYVAADLVGEAEALPSLALAAAAAVRRLTPAARSERQTLRVGSLSIPLVSGDSFLVRWRGSKPTPSTLTYPVIDFDKVIAASWAREEPDDSPFTQDELDAFSEQFRDKVVLVAMTSSGDVHDLRATPLSNAVPGVEIHANALDNLLNDDFNRPAPVWLILSLLIGSAAVAGMAFDTIRSQMITLPLAGLLAVAPFGVAWLALEQGWVVFAATPAITFLFIYLGTTVTHFVEEQRRTLHLRSTFGRYVSPQILEHILAHPEKVELGGERHQLTILFSDIRGFTTISEGASPEEVVEILNEYLSEMVEILLRNGGTLDKFIGDAVMGFWNAPMREPRHAQRAVECAIEMVEATARMREKFVAEGKPELRIGLGINTGEAVAGNIGSKQVFGFTVIGDAVNLASRLEGKNKDFGTEIIISEFTLAAIDQSRFEIEYLDQVKVKGKEQPVRIYQVRGYANEMDSH